MKENLSQVTKQIVSRAYAAQTLSASTGDTIAKGKMDTLIKYGVLSTNAKGRVLADSVSELEKLPNYELVSADDLQTAQALAAVAISGEKLTQSLILSSSNGRINALNELKRRGRVLAPQEEVSGWWQISDSSLDRLIAENSVLLGVIGGYVVEAAKIIEPVLRTSFQNRVSLIIEPITGKDLDKYRGYVPGVRLGTRYVHPLNSSEGD